MPFDAGGTFTRSYSWQADRDNGIKILAQRMDGEFNNYAGGLNQTFLRTGIVPMGGPLNMNSNPITGIKGGSLQNPGIRFESDTDTGIMQSGPGNLTLVVDGVAMLTASSAGGIVMGGTGFMRFPNGSEAAPSISFIDAVSSGFWRDTADGSVNISVSGTKKLIAHSAGALVVGNFAATQASQITGGLTIYSGSVAIPNGNVSASGGFINEANYWMGMQGASPVFNFDANDFMRFDRSINALSTYIGGARSLVVQGGGSVQVGDGGVGLLYIGGGNSYLNTDGGASTWLWDAVGGQDYFQFNKATNVLSGVINGAVLLDLRASGLGTTNISASGEIATSQGSVTAFSPGTGGIRIQPGNPDVTGFINFLSAGATSSRGNIGQISNTGVGPINYVNSTGGGGHWFSGGLVYMDSALRVAGSVSPQDTPNWFIGTTGGHPLLNFDANDYMYYDRSINKYIFLVNGVVMFSFDGGAAYASGPGAGQQEVGYRNLLWQSVTTPGGNVGSHNRGGAVQFLPGAQNYGLPGQATMPQGSIVTLVNSSGVQQTIVEAGAAIYWAANNTRGNFHMAPGAVVSLLWTGGDGVVWTGTGAFQ